MWTHQRYCRRMLQRMLQHNALSDTCFLTSSALHVPASTPPAMQSAASLAPLTILHAARIHTTPPARMPRRKNTSQPMVDTLDEVEENLRGALPACHQLTQQKHQLGFQEAADALLGGSSRGGFPEPPPGLPPPPFDPEENPLDVPDDPKERKEKLHRLLREATGKWQEVKDQEAKPDPVGQYIQGIMAKAAKLLQAQKIEEGLKTLADGIKKAEKELGTSSMHMTLAWDHLAMMQLVCGNVEEALETSKHAVEVAEKKFKGRMMLPVAACYMRQAVIHYTLGNTTEAQAILKRALPAMLMQSSDDFEAIGEAMFYDGLIDLDKAETAAAVEKTTKQLCKGLTVLSNALSGHHPLVHMALVHHNRVVVGISERTPVSSKPGIELVLAALKQNHELLCTQDPRSRQVVMVMAQIAALLYAKGDYAAAVDLLHEGRDIIRLHKKSHPVPDDDVMDMELRHRLGMVSALRGDVDKATDHLQASGPFFEQQMGPTNPFSSEACYAAGRMQLLGVLTGAIDIGDLLPPEGEWSGTREEAEQGAIDSIVKLMSDSLSDMHRVVGPDHLMHHTLERDFKALQRVLSGDAELEELLMKTEND